MKPALHTSTGVRTGEPALAPLEAGATAVVKGRVDRNRTGGLTGTSHSAAQDSAAQQLAEPPMLLRALSRWCIPFGNLV